MKKYLLSFFLIIIFAFYVMLENQSSISVVSSSPDNGTGASGTSPTNNATTAPQTASQAAGSQPVPSPFPAPAAIGLYRNGSYNGDSVDAYFGNVQVEAIVSGGKLADVKILTYPSDRSTSLHINNSALPKLVQEAIASQSAQVDIVSGATQTSQGFQASLASALAKAKS